MSNHKRRFLAKKEREIAEPLVDLEVTGTPEVVKKDSKINLKKFLSSNVVIFLSLFLLSILLKLPGLCRYKNVTWDEHHFGRFMSYYLQRVYFFDVHPPIGRLLVALGGYLLKLDPSFEFDSGKEFPPGYRFCALRIYHTIFSSIAPPMAFIITKELGLPKTMAFAAGMFTALENGTAFYGRLIILDSFLLSFISVAFGLMLATLNSTSKWKHVFLSALTGIFLGLSSGIKYSGAFGAAYICFMTVESLWNIYKNHNHTMKRVASFFTVYAFSLILVPALILTTAFYTHLRIFNKHDKSTTGVLKDYLMKIMHNYSYSANEVTYGGLMTFVAYNYNTANLHSHKNKYPGTDYFQVTCYSFIDENNYIELRPPEFTFYSYSIFLKTDLPAKKAPVRNGDFVVLRHYLTNGIFGVSGVQAPVTKSEYRVENEDFSSFLTDNESNEVPLEAISRHIWIIRDKTMSESSKEPLKMMNSQIIFEHFLTGCVLRMTSENLPYWAVQQHETTCSPKYINNSKGIVWTAVGQVFKDTTTVDIKPRKINYFKNIITLALSTLFVNNSLVSAPECEYTLDSNPLLWPFNLKSGILVKTPDKYGKDGHLAAYNPLIILVSSSSVIISTIVYWLLSAQKKLNASRNVSTNPGVTRFLYVTGRVLLVYYVNYIPYLFMKRQTM